MLDLQGVEDKEVTEEEVRRKQQVQEFVSKLTPEQVVLQQKRVQVRMTLTLGFESRKLCVAFVSLLIFILTY